MSKKLLKKSSAKTLGEMKGIIKQGRYKGKNFEIIIGNGAYKTNMTINGKEMACIKAIKLSIDADKDGYWEAEFKTIKGEI